MVGSICARSRFGYNFQGSRVGITKAASVDWRWIEQISSFNLLARAVFRLVLA